MLELDLYLNCPKLQRVAMSNLTCWDDCIYFSGFVYGVVKCRYDEKEKVWEEIRNKVR